MTEVSFRVPAVPFNVQAQQQADVGTTTAHQPQQEQPKKEHPNPDGRPVDDEGRPVLYCQSTGPLRRSARVDGTVFIPLGANLDQIFGRQFE